MPADPAVGSDRWMFDLAWISGEMEHLTPEQRLLRFAERVACANAHNPVEMGFLVDLANAVVLSAEPQTAHT